MVISSIISSLLLASSFSRIICDYLLKSNLGKFAAVFSVKSFDYINFILFVVLSFGIFLTLYVTNKIVFRNKKLPENYLVEAIPAVGSLLIFIQTYFVFSSGKNIVVFAFFVFPFYFLLKSLVGRSKVGQEFDKNTPLWIYVLNGLFAGYFLSILSSNLTKLTAVPISFIILTPIIYYVLKAKYGEILGNPVHIILIFSALNPTSVGFLLLLAVATVIVGIASARYLSRNNVVKKYMKTVYIFASVFVFAYNPLFYLGSFDSVEEGFWLAWVDRIASGQVMYRDFYAFHPPFITWGLYLFTRIFGSSIFDLRLYMHLLQVVGYFCVFLVINFFIKKKINKVLVFIIVMTLSFTFVRNNTAIRLGSGLAAMLPLFIFLRGKKAKMLFVSGILSAVSFFVSTEIGISAILTVLFISLLYAIKNHDLKVVLWPLGGITSVAGPVFLYLFANHALESFFKQIYFYSVSFSQVYSVNIIEQTQRQPALDWSYLDRFFGSLPWWWEVTKAGLAGGIVYFLYKIIIKKTDYLDFSVLAMTTFGLVLSISFLGRSDYYHLLYILVIAIVLIVYFTEKAAEILPHADKILLTLFLLYFMRGGAQNSFLQSEINKFQAFANPLGNYQKVDIERNGIFVPPGAYAEDAKNLIGYIKSNSTAADKIFVYPWSPEIYYLANRANSTSFDTPLAAFSTFYQNQMVGELESDKPKLVVYNPDVKFLNLSVQSLPEVNDYLNTSFQKVAKIGSTIILSPKK